MTMSLTTSTAIGTGNVVLGTPLTTATLNYPKENYYGYKHTHNFSCNQVENGWILTYNDRHYVFENASDMIARMNALLVESALTK